jgi:hypothetical protein
VLFASIQFSLMAGDVASTVLLRMAVPVLYCQHTVLSRFHMCTIRSRRLFSNLQQ